MRMLSRVSVLLLCAALPLLTHAGEAASYDRITLSATVVDEVENDILEASLYANREGSNPALLSEAVNRDVAWALKQARAVAAVQVRTLGYQTRPVYREQRLTGWRVRQGLHLESTDAAALGQLVGRLQERLAVERVAYRISERRRNEVEDALVARAIGRFRQRAGLVAREMGRKGYRLLSLRIDTPAGGPAPVLHAKAASSASARQAPVFEPGVQTLRVHVSGEIELELD